MDKKTISLCMIVKDEEAYIRRCLESVTKHVDEIIIIDTGSTDATLEIAGEFGAIIYDFKWIEDFSAARNFSIGKAKSDYILVLDADEYLDKDAEIPQSIKDLKDYYIINFNNYMDGGYVSSHQAIRLFKNRIGLKYYGKVHEHLNLDDYEDLTVAFAEFIIHHDGYQKEAYLSKNKYDRNLKILLNEVNENPTGYNLFNLGKQYKVSGNYDEALEVLKRSFPLSKDKVYLPFLLYLMGECLLELKRYKDGINLMKDSVDLFPTYTGFYYLLGMYYEKLNYLKASEDAFKKCIELGEVKHFESLMGVGSYLASIKLSEIQLKQGKHILALESAYSGLELHNRFLPSLNQYFTVLQSAGIVSSQIFNNLKKTFPILDLESLSMLVKVLLIHRSELLNKYINEYSIKVENSVKTIAELYNNNYSEASSLLMKEEQIFKEYFADVIPLCIIQKHNELLSKLLSYMNLNKKEKKFMFILMENVVETEVIIPGPLSEIVIDTLVNLLRLQEETLFWDVFNKLKFPDDKKERLIEKMVDAGFLKQAVTLLEKETTSKKNLKFEGMMADLYIRENKLQEALNIYTNLVDKLGDYHSYNRLYNLYEKINYTDGLVSVKSGMDQLLKIELG
jgi:glycosyltransferase involved in cell wall biosynthesis